MDFGSKLEELELTTDEITRLNKALKDEKFRELLREYTEEISDPENRRRYEEEITQLEQERGVDARFVHPTPHHVLKTSLNGQEKCFINVCSNDLLNQPSCKPGRGEDGRLGQHWSLPYSLAPGRSDRDAKGKKCTVYDVVFHPDTLHIAGKNTRFMELVNSTAFQAVEEGCGVKLDKINAKTLKMQYKGVPQPAVIRKPIPGHPGEKEKKDKALPDEIPELCLPISKPDTALKKNNTAASTAESSSKAQHHPTEPHYTVKYRSHVDLQDYSCSRDSVPSPQPNRPNKIIITIDLPLLRSAGDIDLNVTERSLVLESQKPAYKLDLQLSYPVDSDKGDAKFTKAKKQLTITLPVLPAKTPAVVYAEGKQLVSDAEQRDEKEDKGVDNLEWNKGVSKAQEEANDEQNHTNLCDSGSSDVDWYRDAPIVLEMVQDEERESHCGPSSQSCKAADAPLTCEGIDTETSRPEENHQNDKIEDCLLSGPKCCTSEIEMPSNHHTKEDTDRCSFGKEETYRSDAESTATPAVAALENGKPVPAAEADVSLQHNIMVAQPQILHTVSNSGKEYPDIPNDSNSSLQEPTGKSMANQSSTLEEDNMEAEKTVMQSKEQEMNCSPEHISPQLEHRDIKCAPLIEEINLPLKERADSDLYSPGQTPAILRERNPEDDSEVVINNHSTSAALSFQNSLWFELD
ncbi:protein kintoun [Astyanax mexicanus]|uniref:Protein kintoun n=1 Tax=Astyanax mexicanus TaxID=7994 RepID=A0A8T2L9C1_ASTMX|nr:protein kintoun [Astyanax mexicanus]